MPTSPQPQIWRSNRARYLAIAQYLDRAIIRRADGSPTGIPGNFLPIELALFDLLHGAGTELQTNRNQVLEALLQHARNRTPLQSLEDLERAYEDVRARSHRRKNQQQKREWVLTFAYDRLDLPPGRSSFKLRVGDTLFKIQRRSASSKTRAQFPAELLADSLKYERALSTRLSEAILLITATVHAQDFYSAFRLVEQDFDLMRGFLEVVVNRGSRRLMIGQMKPRREVPLPAIVVGETKDSGGEAGYTWYFGAEADVLRNTHTLSDRHIKMMKDGLKHYATRPRNASIQSVLAQAVRQYANAMDHRQTNERLVGLWQCVETIACLQPHERGSEACARLAVFTSSLSFDSKPALGILHLANQIRNEIVHNGGYDEVDQTLLEGLKLICEKAISWLERISKSVRAGSTTPGGSDLPAA